MINMSRHGTKKKSESPTGIEPMTFPHRSDALTTELRRTLGEQGHIQGSCMAWVVSLGSDMSKSSRV